MARPVDADKLIEWFTPYLHTGETIPADVVIEDIRAMPTLTQPNGWISVEDRLPDKSCDCVVYTDTEELLQIEFDEDVGDNGEFGFWNSYYVEDGYHSSEWIKTDGVTHWLSMPEPPKGEEDT